MHSIREPEIESGAIVSCQVKHADRPTLSFEHLGPKGGGRRFRFLHRLRNHANSKYILRGATFGFDVYFWALGAGGGGDFDVRPI